MAQHFIDELLCHLLVGTAKEQDAVLGILIDLDNGVAGRTVYDLDELVMDAVLLAGIQEHGAVLTDQTAVVDFHAGLGQCTGLVHALAAQEGIPGAGSLGLAGQDDMVYGVDIVNVQRTDI